MIESVKIYLYIYLSLSLLELEKLVDYSNHVSDPLFGFLSFVWQAHIGIILFFTVLRKINTFVMRRHANLLPYRKPALNTILFEVELTSME